MKIRFLAMVIFGEAALSPLLADMPLIDEIAARDKAADDTVAAIRTAEELTAKQRAWRTWWLDAASCPSARRSTPAWWGVPNLTASASKTSSSNRSPACT